MKKKQNKEVKKNKSNELIDILKKHGAQVYDDLENGQFPKFSIPNRSISNIMYDKKLRQYVLGTNTSLRSSRNTSQLRSFTQLLWLAFFANKLTHEKNHQHLGMSIIHLRHFPWTLKIRVNQITL